MANRVAQVAPALYARREDVPRAPAAGGGGTEAPPALGISCGEASLDESSSESSEL